MSSCLPVGLIAGEPVPYGHSIGRSQPLVICPICYYFTGKALFTRNVFLKTARFPLALCQW